MADSVFPEHEINFVHDGGLGLFPFVEDGVQVNHLALTQRVLWYF
jgi:hypothetical protein